MWLTTLEIFAPLPKSRRSWAQKDIKPLLQYQNENKTSRALRNNLC